MYELGLITLSTCTRVNPDLGTITLYTNAASSTYDALQTILKLFVFDSSRRAVSATIEESCGREASDVEEGITSVAPPVNALHV